MFLCLIWEKGHVLESGKSDFFLQVRFLDAIPHEYHKYFWITFQVSRCVNKHVETLRESNVTRVHHDKAVSQLVCGREAISLWPRLDLSTVRPRWYDNRTRWVRSLGLYQATSHALAKHDCSVGRSS